MGWCEGAITYLPLMQFRFVVFFFFLIFRGGGVGKPKGERGEKKKQKAYGRGKALNGLGDMICHGARGGDDERNFDFPARRVYIHLNKYIPPHRNRSLVLAPHKHIYVHHSRPNIHTFT